MNMVPRNQGDDQTGLRSPLNVVPMDSRVGHEVQTNGDKAGRDVQNGGSYSPMAYMTQMSPQYMAYQPMPANFMMNPMSKTHTWKILFKSN